MRFKELVFGAVTACVRGTPSAEARFLKRLPKLKMGKVEVVLAENLQGSETKATVYVGGPLLSGPKPLPFPSPLEVSREVGGMF
jgi:hypothetical protein